MKLMKHVKSSGFLLAGLCMLAVFAFGTAGSASAKVLLFEQKGASFPYHFVGNGAGSTLLTDGGQIIESTETHVLALILNSTLFDVHLEFLKASAEHLGSLGECNTEGQSKGVILANLLGHLGLTHPTDTPGVLLLIDGSILFTCGGITHVHVRGSIIGTITEPALNTEATLMKLKFTQTNGIQNFTQFLLGNELLTNQFQETNILGTTNGYLQSGQSGEALLHALKGSFLIFAE